MLITPIDSVMKLFIFVIPVIVKCIPTIIMPMPVKLTIAGLSIRNPHTNKAYINIKNTNIISIILNHPQSFVNSALLLNKIQFPSIQLQ